MSRFVILFASLAMSLPVAASPTLTPFVVDRTGQDRNPPPLFTPVGGTAQGAVVSFWATSDGIVLVYPSGPVSDAPGCSVHGRFAIDTNSVGGRSMYQALMTSFALAKAVRFYGDGTCSLRDDSESLREIYVVN